ncbi:unnamed protein product [Rhizoctonia solani]|uniref:Uncharacterized protein n=1 Tax=Rhizoctonia solani TaxID=456999 RepID=A0A8H3HU77_9AGAM|nr:unnamed protein product [Rhizoctonia solani]
MSIDLNSLPEQFNTNTLEITQRELRALESDFHGLGTLDGTSATKLHLYLKQLMPHAKLEPLLTVYLESVRNPDRRLDLACVGSMNLMEFFFEIVRNHHPDGATLAPGGHPLSRGDSILTQAALVWDTVRNYSKETIEAEKQENPKLVVSE